MQANSRTNDHGSHADLAVLAALGVTTVLLTILVARLPAVVGGSYVDDGVYLVTAKSLAEGHGYRHLELPGEPYQTKYPVLYPLLLSVLWRWFPIFVGHALVYEVTNPVLWGIGSWLAYRLMRRAWGLPWWMAAAGVLLAFLDPHVLKMLRTTMSEPLYFALSMAALNLLIVPQSAQGTRSTCGPGLVGTVFSAALAAAAYLTRSIGVTLVAALLAGLLLRRQWKQATIMALVAACALGGWQAWRRSATADNAALPAFTALRYDLDYSAQFPSSLGTAAWVVYQNTSDAALALLEVLVEPPEAWTAGAPGGGLAGGFPLYAGLIVASALLLNGLWTTWNRGPRGAHLYLLFYLGIVLAWPFRPLRFLIPVVPLITTLQLAGLYAAVVFCAGRVLRRARAQPKSAGAPQRMAPADLWTGARPGAEAGFRLVMALVLVLGAVRGGPLIRIAPDAPDFVGDSEKEMHDRDALIELLLAQTPSDAVISCSYGAYLYLRTGRKYVLPMSSDDPITVAYAPDRRFSECGCLATPGMISADLQMLNRRYIDYLRTAGVSYVIPPEKRIKTYWAAFDEWCRSEPEQVRLVGNAPPYALYRVSLPPR